MTNMTNVDMLGARKKVYQIAVRIPRDTEGGDKYHTVTYPLPQAAQSSNGQLNNVAANGGMRIDRTRGSTGSGRDTLATRRFAILKTEPGENPWDLGLWRNWQEVMGLTVLDWFLPIRRSPCVDHDHPESYYRMDKILKNIRVRYGIDAISADETDRMELRQLQRNST